MDSRYEAGATSPELARRDKIVERASVAFWRIARRRSARSLILYDPRGAGKIALLQRMASQAETSGLTSVVIDSSEGRSLASMLGTALRAALVQMGHGEPAKAVRSRFEDAELDLDSGDKPAESCTLEADLIVRMGRSAADYDTAIVLVIDELHRVPETELSAMIAALHRASQQQLPMILLAAGLPQVLAQMGTAKPYADRMFEFVPIGSVAAGAVP